ncbi:unnamed protein product [Pleuronectes platessa]|uniref:Uncharacterized protein n=1 Tax=Pleuronectes platessa TaxID=8262 RepID=A0A9N7TTR3_PLEPL|nr:unnamed protein product [Pleuronectes platessa]
MKAPLPQLLIERCPSAQTGGAHTSDQLPPPVMSACGGEDDVSTAEQLDYYSLVETVRDEHVGNLENQCRPGSLWWKRTVPAQAARSLEPEAHRAGRLADKCAASAKISRFPRVASGHVPLHAEMLQITHHS